MRSSSRACFLIVLCSLFFVPLRAQADDLSIDDFFRQSAFLETTLSPDGEYLAYAKDDWIYAGNSMDGFFSLYNYCCNRRIGGITWLGKDTIAIELIARRELTRWVVIRFSVDESGEGMVAEQSVHDMEGYIHDPLVADSGRMLFAGFQESDDHLAADIYEFNVFGETKRQLRRRNRVRTGSRKFFYYLQDANGNYVAGVERREKDFAIWYSEPGSKGWTERRSIDTDRTFVPYAVTSDQKLLALTDSFSDKVAAVALDLTSAIRDEVLFEHPRYDLVGLMMSQGGDGISAVSYIERGSPILEFLDPVAKTEFDQLASGFEDQSFLIMDSTPDGKVKLAVASSPSNPGVLYTCTTSELDCQIVGSAAPWLDNARLGDSFSLEVLSSDGLQIEAYLTTPPTAGDRVPLIVIPHGGPIGVQDSRAFSSEAQWLAHNGYAVLQVNYRGSGGFGRAFQTAGLREWGRGIEDDIESSVTRVLNEFPIVDPDRVGIYGGSYGGYSALMGVIRNPELFKCAASFAGVTDLSLVFSQGRIKRNEDLRELLVEIVGDPEEDFQEMRENSPVYRYREIDRPVLLAHGVRDAIVDVEHAWRLFKLLELRDKKPELLILDNVGHGFRYLSEVRSLYEPLLEFLDEHLKN